MWRFFDFYSAVAVSQRAHASAARPSLNPRMGLARIAGQAGHELAIL